MLAPIHQGRRCGAIPFALPALSNGLGGGAPASSRETGQLRILMDWAVESQPAAVRPGSYAYYGVCESANGQGCAGQETADGV